MGKIGEDKDIEKLPLMRYFYGYHSASQRSAIGYVVWETPLGEKVELTEVADTVDYVPLYSDSVYVGVVTRFVKSYGTRVGV